MIFKSYTRSLSLISQYSSRIEYKVIALNIKRL